ncbi:universal stress protein [Nocardioides aurantiacus]|uniref:Universal stress protein family protein n=1 Tax=Nocardioides aurantiacus TaxID=86796 RepID=A0A3N2CQ81_9ACTN|nr:universal stress protein [Nocardioides aurantiacus]ROR89673.1 universal stress protein family protein [Nocardioides aurantiacus]
MSIVVAYTPDAYGQAALDHGAAEAVRRGTDLVVVNATKGDALVDPRYAHEDQIAAITSDLEGRGVTVTVRHEVVPDVAQAVLEVARETDAALVVVGVRHRSPVGKALMGSVGQRILLDATCPVLAVKPPA